MRNVLVIGLGRFGRHCASKLLELGHQVLAIDRNQNRVEAALNFMNNVAIGDDFQSSLETTALLKEMGAKKVVARASRDIHAKFLLNNGADEVVYPERVIAEWTATKHSADCILDYISLDEKHALFEIDVPERWVGKSLSQLNVRRKYNINVVAIKDGEDFIAGFDPDMPLQAHQTIMIIGLNKDVMKLIN